MTTCIISSTFSNPKKKIVPPKEFKIHTTQTLRKKQLRLIVISSIYSTVSCGSHDSSSHGSDSFCLFKISSKNITILTYLQFYFSICYFVPTVKLYLSNISSVAPYWPSSVPFIRMVISALQNLMTQFSTQPAIFYEDINSF